MSSCPILCQQEAEVVHSRSATADPRLKFLTRPRSAFSALGSTSPPAEQADRFTKSLQLSLPRTFCSFFCLASCQRMQASDDFSRSQEGNAFAWCFPLLACNSDSELVAANQLQSSWPFFWVETQRIPATEAVSEHVHRLIARGGLFFLFLLLFLNRSLFGS